MDDLISRKAVFELLDDIDSIYLEDYDDTFKSYTDLVNALFDEDRLPSAQPKKRTEERTETHACDCISRQAAIDAVDKRFDSIPMEQTTEILLLRKDLRELPPTQPEVLACGEGELIAQPEIVRCKDCTYWVAHDKRCVYLNHGFAPNMWCCHGRRADG